MRIVFAKTRHEYDSYRDLRSLVELSGFETCFVDEMDLTAEAVYIATPINGEFRPHIDHRRSILSGAQKAVIVWWNLERPDTEGSPPITDVVSDVLQYADAVWVSDRHYQCMDTRMHHVVLGSHPGLMMRSEISPKQFEYTHQSYVWGRREKIYIPLRSAGMREGPNSWFEQRDEILRSSKLMLNVHQTPSLIGEPIRFALTAAYKMPMISETLVEPYPLNPGTDFLNMRFHELVGAVVAASLNPVTLRGLGENLHNRLCVEWTFRRGVEEGVSYTLGKLRR